MKFAKNIKTLKSICQRLEDNYDDDEFSLSEHEEEELYKITGIEQHDWDENNLAHFIDGMQRALHLLEVYESVTNPSKDSEEKK